MSAFHMTPFQPVSTLDRARRFRRIELAARAMADEARELVDVPLVEILTQAAERAGEVARLDEIQPGREERADAVTQEIPIPQKEP